MRSGRATIQQRLGQELVRLAYVGLDTRTLRNETVSLLYQFLHVDAIWWALADPGTLLFSRALSHGVCLRRPHPCSWKTNCFTTT
jgi:hypothetical protein